MSQREFSVFDPLNDALVHHSYLLIETLGRFDPGVRMRVAEIFTEALLEDVRLSIEVEEKPPTLTNS